MRFLLRMTGYGFVALGFIALVLDGARSIANVDLRVASLGEVLQGLLPERYALIGPAIARGLHPWLAEPAFATAMQAPFCAVALVLGFLLLWAGRSPAPQIGFVTRQ